MAYREIICLANSKRPGGYCFAGKDCSTGEWVRPISGRSKHSIWKSEQKFADGTIPRLLDIVEVPVTDKVSVSEAPYQAENYGLDSGPWIKKGKASWEQACNLVDAVDDLWVCPKSPKSDRIHKDSFSVFNRSLCLISLPNLLIEKNSSDKLKVGFEFGGISYSLSVTDPEIKRKYASMGGNRQSKISESVLACISLAEPYRGYAYKLMAGLATVRDAGN